MLTLLEMALPDRSKSLVDKGKPQKLEITSEKLTLRSRHCPAGALGGVHAEGLTSSTFVSGWEFGCFAAAQSGKPVAFRQVQIIFFRRLRLHFAWPLKYLARPTVTRSDRPVLYQSRKSLRASPW